MAELSAYAEVLLPADLKEQIRSLMQAVWPDVFQGQKAQRSWLHDPDLRPTCMMLVEGGQVVSYAGALWKTLEHAGQTYIAYGLSGVLTHPAFRRRGYGRGIVEAATALMRANGADLGLFTCDPPLRSFYEGCGWSVVDGSPLIGGTRDKPFPSDSLGKLTMMRFFSEKAQRFRSSFEGTPIWLDLREGDLW